MAVVLGNLHATAQGPTDDESDGDVQFMHTFVLERGRRLGGHGRRRGGEPRRLAANREQFAIVDEVFRRVDPVGDARAPGGLAAGAASLLRAAQSPPPTRAGGGRMTARRRRGAPKPEPPTGNRARVWRKITKNGEKRGQTPAADAPEDGGDSPESTKTRKTPPPTTLDDSVDEADVWLTNPMYGDVPDTNPGRQNAQTGGTITAQTETPRAVRRAPGSAEVVPEAPAINFASPNPFEDEARGREGGRGAEGDAEAGRRRRGCPEEVRGREDVNRRGGSIPFPSRSLLGPTAPHVHAPRAGGRPGIDTSPWLNRVSSAYSHVGGRGNKAGRSSTSRRAPTEVGVHDEATATISTTILMDRRRGGGDDLGGCRGCRGCRGRRAGRRARRKERSVAGPRARRQCLVRV